MKSPSRLKIRLLAIAHRTNKFCRVCIAACTAVSSWSISAASDRATHADIEAVWRMIETLERSESRVRRRDAERDISC